MKKFTCIKRAMMVLAVLLSTCVSSWAAEDFDADFEVDGIYYNISGSNATVTREYNDAPYGSYSGDVVIPETVTYNGTTYNVTAIGKQAFKSCIKLNTVTIPKSVASIDVSAFDSSTALTCIIVSQDNENYCSADGVLFDKEMTELIRYPQGKQDESYEIPSSVTSIGYGAFFACLLKEVDISDGVTSIGEGAFAFCEALVSATIGSGVTKIGRNAFSGCTALEYLTIGESVATIGYSAFYDCASLSEITSLNPTPPTIQSNTFDYVDKENCILYVPEGSVDLYAKTSRWKEFYNIEAASLDEIAVDPIPAIEAARYDLNGRMLSEPQTGVNIVRFSDGSVEKILVK